jgi:hypothetical protein
MTDLHKDIWQQIEEQRANYQRIINAATDTINNARKLIADAREGMDSLPVAKTRRARKGDGVIAALGMVEVDEEGAEV